MAISALPAVAATNDCNLGSADYCPNPFVHTLPAVEVGPHSAVLRGEVDPNGNRGTCFFEYGTTKSYGMVTSPLLHFKPGMKPVQFRARITGLMEGTEYHYQLVCKTSGNTFLGGDVVFHTTRHAPAPSPTAKARAERHRRH